MAQLLLEKGAKADAEGIGYCHALSTALGNDHEEVLRLLLKNEAKVNAEGEECPSARQQHRVTVMRI